MYLDIQQPTILHPGVRIENKTGDLLVELPIKTFDAVAEEMKAGVEGAVTEIETAATFWPAEVYHQQYLEKGGRFGSGQSAAKGCTDKIRCYG